MLKRFTRYVTQSVAGMIGISVYVLADTFFISVYSGADGLAVLNLILPVYGLIYAIGLLFVLSAPSVVLRKLQKTILLLRLLPLQFLQLYAHFPIFFYV